MNRATRPWPLRVAIGVGYAFLYIPLLCVVAYSFNESRLVTVWGGFSTKWYAALFANQPILDAATRSFAIAAAAATGAVVIGTLAALALSRRPAPRGRAALSLLVAAPLVMPEVILGLSALLLFVGMQQAVGWPAGRGMLTIGIAHVTFCACYAAVVVRARLSQLDPALAEAAMDLGARPHAVFWRVTLPLIAPALVAAWLLAFTLSLDDLVVASFTSGPGSSTLPMLIYSKVKLGVTPEMNALATIVIGGVALLVGFASWLLFQRRGAASHDKVPTNVRPDAGSK
jgi:putrescine transport system permease protein